MARRAGVACCLALLGAMGVAQPRLASAANIYPAPSTTVTPWSWPQFKQTYGYQGYQADSAYAVANPGAPTVFAGSALSESSLTVLGLGAVTGITFNPDGTELRGFVLGDYGDLEPNSTVTTPGPDFGEQNSTYNFYEVDGTSNITQSNITGWVSPLYAISNERDRVLVTEDDNRNETGPNDATPIIVGTTNQTGFTQITTTNALGQVGNTYWQALTTPTNSPTFSWTLIAPTAGYYTIYANIPEGVGPTVTDAPYTITTTNYGNSVTANGTVDQALAGYQLVGGVTTTTANQSVVVTLTANSATAGQLVYADAVQLRQPYQATIDNTDPPTTVDNTFEVIQGTDSFASDINAQDYTGADYLESPLIARGTNDAATAGASYADWAFNVPTAGSYSLSVYYPVQYGVLNAGGTALTPEYFATDAEYTVKFYGPNLTPADLTTADLANQTVGSDYLVYQQTVTIDQSHNGGQFNKILGPFNIPAGYTCVLQLDNTSNNTSVVSGTAITRIVAADAAQLNYDDGSVYGAPVAGNVSEYPELRYGYNTADTAYVPASSTETSLVGTTTASGGGGQPVFYTAPFVNSLTGAQNSAIEQYHGLPSTATATTLGLTTGATTLIPDAEVTYFGRTENLRYNGTNGGDFETPGPASQSGAVYAVDGLNGNIIWKYGTTNDIVDDSNTVDFAETNFSASQNAPATGYYSVGYRTAAAVTGAATPNATAQWTLPLAAGSGTAEYAVYVWFPNPTASTANPAEAHIDDAQYSIPDVENNASTTVTVSVDQTQGGGQFVQITNPNRADGSFVLGPGASSVSLSNYNQDGKAVYTDGPSTTATPDVVADAVMFVPIDNTGTVMSTPVLVRQMNVLTSAGTYQPRDVVIFTDNLGKVYCVDAAGNQDADNTLIDQDTGAAVSTDSAGYPANPPNTDGTNGQYTGITLPTPYNLSVRNYGTTTVYWIWQPSAATSAVILHTLHGLGSADSAETVPDANRDMPVPSSFLMNSPTVALSPDKKKPWYDATLFVGNPNGYIYSLDASGVVSNAGTSAELTDITAADYKQYRLSQNPSINTVDVNWWFNTGESIAYAPAFDASTTITSTTTGQATTYDQRVYVTTYNSAYDNIGHLYSLDAANGGVGNDGAGFIGPASSYAPTSYNYNVTPVSLWSFPDKYGNVLNGALPANHHIYNSKVADGGPALPLGDMPGSPNVETLTSDGLTRILVCANDPGPPTQAGRTGYGRTYSINEDGSFNWAYPATDQAGTANSIGPNAVGETDDTTYATVYNQGSYESGGTYDANGETDGTLNENDFATVVTQNDLYVSSSPASAIINFPTTPLTGDLSATNAALLTAQAVPMAYVGTLGGHLLALDLNGGIVPDNAQSFDQGRHLISDTTVGQSAPIYSTPAILPGSTHTGSGTTPQVGGAIFLNAGDPAFYELGALPVTTDGNGLPVEEQYFTYDTLGAISSPALSAFDTALFINGSTTQNGASAQTIGGDVEFVYSGTDNGFCFGLTPNATTSNPGGGGTGYFNPGAYIPPGNLPPPTANTSAPNKTIVVRLSSIANNPSYTVNSYGANSAALYDWGQSAYVQVFGVYQPGPTQANPNVTPPYSLQLTYSLSGGGKQTGGSRTIQLTADNVKPATGVPASVSALFDGNQTYVATFPITIGESTAFLPGSRRSLRNLTLTYVDANGTQQTIRLNQGSATRYRNSAASASSSIISTPAPATLTILNPLAVTASGKTLDNVPGDFRPIGIVGPFGGATKQFYTQGQVPGILQEAEVNDNPVVNGVRSLVAVGLGDISHNTAGDSSVAANYDPSNSTGENDPVYSVGGPYYTGSSLLIIADRSALGSIGQSISNVYMSNDTDSQLAWNDNSGQEGPGSIINNLSWDTAPVDQHQNPTGNPSPDYPNISANNLTATLKALTGATESGATNYNTSGNVSYPYGVSATITSSGGTLAPSTVGNVGPGDPNGSRTIFPMATVVKVAVPRYQPANLEVYRPAMPTPRTDGGGVTFPNGTEVPHADTMNPLVPSTDVPEGYYAKSRVFIDLSNSGSHRFDPNTSAYRSVDVMVGVPVDMGMSIDQPTVDLGTVPAGFADQVIQDVNGTQTPLTWEPYQRGNGSPPNPTSAALQNSELFGQYYQPITVRNNGNVNLLNVHVDGNVYLDGATTAQSYIRLNSDQAQTAYTSPSGLPVNDWTDSLSFIPSIDPTGLLMNNTSSSNAELLLRSSLDTDVYLPNPTEADLAGNAEGNHSAYTNATLHKPRPGDAASTVLTVPDEPHDSGNPAYIALTTTSGSATVPNVPYYGQPVVGIAVPLGTPSGTYSGTIRTYEGSDPYSPASPNPILGNGLSGTYSGPAYVLAKYNSNNPTNPKNPTAFYVNNSSGVPEQYYSDPGTTLKIAVRESRFTDGAPLFGAVNSATNPFAALMALPSGDAGPAASSQQAGVLPTNDVQPFVFSLPTGDSNLSNMGLLFVSNRKTIGTAPNQFDLYGSAIASSNSGGSAFTAPSGSNNGQVTWWSAPYDMTTGLTNPTGTLAVGTAASQVSSPFEISDSSGDSAAFFVLRNVVTSTGGSTQSATGAPIYTLLEAPLSIATGSSGATINLGAATTVYTSSDPIYGVHAVEMPDTGNTKQIVVLWQARVRGRSRVEYLTGQPTSGVMLPSTNAVPRELPVSASLVDVQSPSPVLRYIDAGNANSIAASNNYIASSSNANALDITYSGTLQDGTTDLYTSRYYLAAASGTTSPTLTRIAVVPQNSAPGYTYETLALTRSSTDTGMFIARDVDWAANVNAITVNYTVGGTTGAIPINPQAYTYDKASGQLVYTKVQLPWQNAGTLDTVYVNPGLGIVRFSTPPTDPTTIITATVVPLSERITYNSRTNTEPVAFLDDAIEPSIATSGNASTIIGGIAVQPVNVSREWFIYRKSGSSTGATAATNNTLYYDTRRLTINMNLVTAGNSVPTTSFATTTSTQTVKGVATQVTTLAGGFDVKVSTTNGGGGTDVTQYVDVDPARARIYFPSNMEGLYATIAYVDQTGTTRGPTTVQTPITWADEPYVNSQSPNLLASGEHVLPIATSVNESNPSAFLDPTSGYDNTLSSYVPHRVWVFWSSTRNAAQQAYSNGTGSTGSDLYYESIAPQFTPDMP